MELQQLSAGKSKSLNQVWLSLRYASLKVRHLGAEMLPSPLQASLSRSNGFEIFLQVALKISTKAGRGGAHL